MPERYESVYEREIRIAYYHADIWTYFKHRSLGYPETMKYEIECFSAMDPFVACLVKDKFNTYLLWCDNGSCEE